MQRTSKKHHTLLVTHALFKAYPQVTGVGNKFVLSSDHQAKTHSMGIAVYGEDNGSFFGVAKSQALLVVCGEELKISQDDIYTYIVCLDVMTAN